MTAIGAFATPPNSAIMPTITKGAGVAGSQPTRPCSTPQNAPPSMPPMNRPGANTPPLPPEPIVSDVARIFSTTSAAIVADRQLGGVVVDSELQPPVSHREDLRAPSAIRPQQATDRRFEMRRDPQAMEEVASAVERAYVEQAHQAGHDPKHGIPDERLGLIERRPVASPRPASSPPRPQRCCSR